MNTNYFYLTNQMNASLSWNSFVTEDKIKCYIILLHHDDFYNFNQKRPTLKRIREFYYIGQNLNHAGSFKDDLFAMPVRPSQ